MNILVIYYSFRQNERATITDHLASIGRYSTDCRVFYLDLSHPDKLTKNIVSFPFDAVIYHYTFLALRLFETSPPTFLYDVKERLSHLSGVKAMIPHDEYLCCDALCRMTHEWQIDYIFTSIKPCDFDKIFADKRPECQLLFVFTGYVEQRRLRDIKRFEKTVTRQIDVGYRVLKSCFLFGHHGNRKEQLAHTFTDTLLKEPDIKFDIKLTDNAYNNTLVGDEWFRFLLSCRTTLGCLGGSSFSDASGEITQGIHDYLKDHKDATFAQVSSLFYPEQDDNISTFILGPRHFEAAMTNTAQVLIAGDYSGVLRPGEHYIELLADFSNISDVIEKIKDRALCEKIAADAYKHVVESGLYSYKAFAEFVIRTMFPTRIKPAAGNFAAVKLSFYLWLQPKKEKFVKNIFIPFSKSCIGVYWWFYGYVTRFFRFCAHCRRRLRDLPKTIYHIYCKAVLTVKAKNPKFILAVKKFFGKH